MPLIDQQKDLAAQLEKVNAQIDRQKALNAFMPIPTGSTSAARASSAAAPTTSGRRRHGRPAVLAGKAAMDFSSGMVDIAQKANLTQDQTNAMAQGILRAAQCRPPDARGHAAGRRCARASASTRAKPCR
jgi:anaerobic glycerol-3-phosphate dehydrogenase